jgi:hypothetical protein
LYEYGSVKGDDNIRAEIQARGPVSAYINAECIETYTSGVNLYDTCNTRTTNHAIQIAGTLCFVYFVCSARLLFNARVYCVVAMFQSFRTACVFVSLYCTTY